MYVDSSATTHSGVASTGTTQQDPPPQETNGQTDFAVLLEALQKINENLEKGLPADYDKEQDGGRDDLDKLEDGDAKTHARHEDETINRIRTMLEVTGFNPAQIDEYLDAMKMPELQGDANGDLKAQQELQEQLHEQALEEQKRKQEVTQSLTTQQQTTSSLTGPVSGDNSSTNSPDNPPSDADRLMTWLLQPAPDISTEQAPLSSLREDILKMRSILG